MNKPGIPLEDVIDASVKRRKRRNRDKALRASCAVFIALNIVFIIGYSVSKYV
jgi:hypothetical protein